MVGEKGLWCSPPLIRYKCGQEAEANHRHRDDLYGSALARDIALKVEGCQEENQAVGHEEESST
jgi:hypothetical protein